MFPDLLLPHGVLHPVLGSTVPPKALFRTCVWDLLVLVSVGLAGLQQPVNTAVGMFGRDPEHDKLQTPCASTGKAHPPQWAWGRYVEEKGRGRLNPPTSSWSWEN